jgi:hypothetical protein
MSSRDDRRDDTWLSDAQQAKCARADHAEAFRSPVPVQIVSNGEYMPMPQTAEQQRVEARTKELADGAARKLGISRRKFLASTGGMAAAFLAMNEVFGRFFDVSPVEMFEAEAFAATGAPRHLFVFDDQLHMVRSSILGPRALRALGQGSTSPRPEFPSNPFNPGGLLDELGNPWSNWNPALINDPMGEGIFHLVQFIKDLYFDSQVTTGVLSNISGFLPGFIENGIPKNTDDAEKLEILTAAQTAGVRNFVNRIAGSQRLHAHGILYPGVGNLNNIRRQIDENEPDSWKGYCISLAAKVDHDPNSLMREWRIDDEAVAYPTYELITQYQRRLRRARPGFGNICVHKGFAPVDVPADDRPERGNPDDIPKAARDWPNFNFIIYHACVGPVLFYSPDPIRQLLSTNPPLREGVPDIRWTTRFAVSTRPFPNVYAEIGSTFASTVITFPTVWAHLIGQLMKFMGSRRIVFGSDSLWYGSPQWQIEAFWRFQIPEAIRTRWGYPELTEDDKRNILGLNSARLYDVSTSRHAYRLVPRNFESRIPDDLKTLLEFPDRAEDEDDDHREGDDDHRGRHGGDGHESRGASARRPFASDNLSKLKAWYLAEGAVPDHRRYGWIRTKV